MGQGVIGILAGRIGITHDVEPMAAPLFAVVGRVQQPFDDGGKRRGRGVGLERRHLLRRWRQTRQVKRGSPDQRSPVGGRSRADAGRFLLRE